MPVLSIALAGMRRRIFSTLFTLFSTTAILTTAVILGFWAYWIHGDQANLKAHRSAAIFVDPVQAPTLSEMLAKVEAMTGVDTAVQIGKEDFLEYLDEYFPDLKSTISDLGEEILPTMIEVNFVRGMGSQARENTIRALSEIDGTIRVDDGAKHVGSAVTSLNWLSKGAAIMAFCLWLVLVVVSFTHFQAVQFKELQEIKLLRGFGASESWILLPWLVEAVFYGVLSSAVGIGVLWFGRLQLSVLFNQFFETLGYEKFVLNNQAVLWAGVAILVAGFVAHILGGLVALLRGKFA